MKEIEGYRQLASSGSGAPGGIWFQHGRRAWIGTHAAALAHAISLRSQPFPGTGGAFAPVANRIRTVFNPNGVKGTALNLAEYGTPNIEVFDREAGKAKISMRAVQGPARKRPDLDEPDEEYIGAIWRHVAGDAVMTPARVIMDIQTAYRRAEVKPTDVVAVVDRVNSSAVQISDYQAFGAEMLLMRAVETLWQFGSELMGVNYQIEIFNGPAGQNWNTGVRREIGTWVVQRLPVVDTEGAAVLDDDSEQVFRHAQVFVPGEVLTKQPDGTFTLEAHPNPTEGFAIYPLADFRLLQGLTEW